MSSISIKKATMINFIARYSNIFMQLIINSILARLLTPDDYGVISVINVFISFFTILADMGVGPAIIQNKELDKEDISSIFSFTIFIGVITAVAFFIFSYPISIIYNNQVYSVLGKILTISIFFSVINIVPNSLLLKQKKFKLLGIRTVIINLVCGIITIVVAINGFKYYSLVINSILVSTLTFIFNYLNTKIKIKIKVSKKSINKIKSFSVYQFGFNFINYFSRNLDNLSVGKVLGAVPLGYYDKAYKLMLYPVQNLTYVITPVLQPILSEYQNDKEYIYEKYKKIIKVLSLLGIFFSVFCYFSSKEIILIMFGENWSKSISVFQILSISIWPQVITSSTGAIFQSLGKAKTLFVCGIVTTIVNIICLIISLCFKDIKIVAIGITISYITSFFVAYFMLIVKVFERGLWEFIKLFKSTLIIAILMIISFIIFESYFYIDKVLISIIIKLIWATIVYVVGIVITGEFKFVTSFFSRK